LAKPLPAALEAVFLFVQPAFLDELMDAVSALPPGAGAPALRFGSGDAAQRLRMSGFRRNNLRLNRGSRFDSRRWKALFVVLIFRDSRREIRALRPRDLIRKGEGTILPIAHGDSLFSFSFWSDISPLYYTLLRPFWEPPKIALSPIVIGKNGE
jgi:hypothetical protein